MVHCREMHDSCIVHMTNLCDLGVRAQSPEQLPSVGLKAWVSGLQYTHKLSTHDAAFLPKGAHRSSLASMQEAEWVCRAEKRGSHLLHELGLSATVHAAFNPTAVAFGPRSGQKRQG